MGRQERQELRNHLSIVIGHLLKWQYQPTYQSRSWLATIRVQRRDILRLLKENPSLKSYFDEALLEAYENAKDLAMGKTNLPLETFPLNCPYSPLEILKNDFFPS